MPATPAGAPARGSLWRLWTAGESRCSAFANARSALAAVLAGRSAKRVWLPAYACPALAQAAGSAVDDVRFYDVGATLDAGAARLAASLAVGDAVVVVDFFGRPPGAAWRALAARTDDVLWIEDRAQALDTGGAAPLGHARLFSPRKLIGAGDGGLLVGDDPLPEPCGVADGLWRPEDARALDVDGERPDDWYGLFREREAAMRVGVHGASQRTLAALASVAAEPIAAARRANWRVLAGGLCDYALWADPRVDFAPLAFPILVDDAALAVSRLAQRRIWAPRHWADPPSPAAEFESAHWLASHCVSLPLDQRYGVSDMERVVGAVRDCARPAGAR